MFTINIEWHDLLSVGINQIDHQHKELLARYNNLLFACRSGKGKEELVKLLMFLDEYVVEHFHEEEGMQRRHSYSQYEKHKREHDEFIKALKTLKTEIETDGIAVHNVIETNHFLRRWLIDHISGSDKDVGSYLKSIAISR